MIYFKFITVSSSKIMTIQLDIFVMVIDGSLKF